MGGNYIGQDGVEGKVLRLRSAKIGQLRYTKSGKKEKESAIREK